MKGQWEEYIRKNPFAIAWQSYDWLDVLKKHYDFEFFPITAFDNSEICGVLPLYRISTFFEKNILVSVPYAVAGGIVADDDDARAALLNEAISLHRKYNCSKIILKHYKQKVDADLATDDNYYNRELSLSAGIDNIWNNLHDTNKRNIDAVDKFDLSLEYPFQNIDAFFDLLLRHHQRMGVPCVSKKWITSLVDSGMYSIACLYRNNTPVAGTVVKVFKKTVSFPFTCLPDGEAENEMFAYNLYWRLIKHFASQGFEIAHSGRIPQNDQTNAYRLGWGGKKYGYFYQYYPDPGTKTEYAVKRGRKRKIFQSAWKMLPRSAAGILGPHIVKHFP